jgi:hypothetical protein
MNIFQRIILVLGAAALIAAILTTPLIVIVQGTYHDKPSEEVLSQYKFQPMISPATALIRSVGVIGVTVFLFLALRGEIKKRPKKTKPKK